MSPPITWRSVTGPSLADAALPLNSAQNIFSKGFSAFDSALQEQYKIEKDNWELQKAANTNDALNRLYDTKTPEQMRQLQESGQLSNMLNGYGQQIDSAAVRAAMDARPEILQKRAQEGWKYEGALRENTEAPVIGQAKALIAQGKLSEAIPIINSLSPQSQADLYVASDTKTQQLLDREHKAKLRPLELAQMQANIDNSRASAGNAGVQGEAARFNLAIAKEAYKLSEKQARLNLALKDNPYKEGIISYDSTSELRKFMDENNIAADNKGSWNDDTIEKRAKLQERIDRVIRNGMIVNTVDDTGKPIKVRVDVPLSIVKSALLASPNRFWSINSGAADSFDDALKKQINSGTVKKLLGDYRDYKTILEAQSTIPVKIPKAGR